MRKIVTLSLIAVFLGCATLAVAAPVRMIQTLPLKSNIIIQKQTLSPQQINELNAAITYYVDLSTKLSDSHVKLTIGNPSLYNTSLYDLSAQINIMKLTNLINNLKGISSDIDSQSNTNIKDTQALLISLLQDINVNLNDVFNQATSAQAKTDVAKHEKPFYSYNVNYIFRKDAIEADFLNAQIYLEDTRMLFDNIVKAAETGGTGSKVVSIRFYPTYKELLKRFPISTITITTTSTTTTTQKHGPKQKTSR